jgi:DNA repair exonuclease SbcCD ATPase subunit
MKLNFEKLEITNFMSYGDNTQEFVFNKSGLSLLTAKNGDGKSSVSSALYYVLFGKSDRKIKGEELINDINLKKMKCVLYFEINGYNYKIERGMKPAIFKIYKFDNDSFELININSSIKEYQKYLEVNILHGLTENIFKQILYLGANITDSKNFMDLNKKEKEEVFQILMDTTIFSELQEKCKKLKKDNKTKFQELDFKIQNLKNDVVQLNIHKSKILKEKEDIIKNKQNIINGFKNDVLILEKEILKNNEFIQKFSDIDIKFEKLIEIQSSLKNEISNITKEINSHNFNIKSYIYEEENKIICNKCNNEIKKVFEFDFNEEKEKVKKLTLMLEDLNIKLSDIQAKIQKVRDLKNNISNLSSNNLSKTNDIKNIRIKIENVENLKEQEFDETLIENKQKDIIKYEDLLISLSKETSNVDKLTDLLSDKQLKGEMLKNQMPILNYNINLYLEKLNFPYYFKMNEDFSETIIANKKEKSFNSLSNGQKMRIIISILFSFLKLSELKSNISFNILILDEFINGSLDEDGVEEILKLLKTDFSEQKEILLITHNSTIKDQDEIFDNSFKVKRDIFSEIIKI